MTVKGNQDAYNFVWIEMIILSHHLDGVSDA